MKRTVGMFAGWWVWVIDAIVVLSFTVIGRDSHGMASDWGEVVRISTPFVIGLLVAIAATPILANRWDVFEPVSPATGAWVGIVTLSVGMLLRRFVFDGGTAGVFIVIASAWFIGLMVGWRILFGVGRRFVASRS